MTKETNTVYRNNLPGTMSLLGFVFIGLKVTDHIDWSWFYVLMPFWIGLAIFAGIMAGGALLVGLAALGIAILEGFETRRRRKARAAR